VRRKEPNGLDHPAHTQEGRDNIGFCLLFSKAGPQILYNWKGATTRQVHYGRVRDRGMKKES